MIKEALEYLFKRGEDVQRFEELNGFKYTNLEMHPILPPEFINPDCLNLRSLTGLVDYIKKLRPHDLPEGAVLSLHVADFETVNLIGTLDSKNFNKRFTYAKASADITRYQFDQWDTQEDFILSLLSRFVQTEESDKLRTMVSKITLDSKVEVEDDGATQRVSYRSGIAVMDSMRIESPIMLKPFSTFLEVDQPEVACVCRVGKDGKEGKVPYVRLTMADGGLWKLEAMANIKSWLTAALDGSVEVLA